MPLKNPGTLLLGITALHSIIWLTTEVKTYAADQPLAEPKDRKKSWKSIKVLPTLKKRAQSDVAILA